MRTRVLALVAALATPATPQVLTTNPYVSVRSFAVGERAEYDLRWSTFLISKGAGTAVLELGAIDPVRGRDAYRFMFAIDGGAFTYSIRDTLRSWVDTSTFRTLRFHQDQVEKNKRSRIRRYEIFPERAVFAEGANPEKPSVIDPLDEVSFLYFLRTLDLRANTPHIYSRYFQPETNPVRITVLRREMLEVPWGKVNTIVVRPIIRSKKMFSEENKTEVWVTDDSARVIVQMKAGLSFGTLTMKIKSYRASATSAVLTKR